MRQLSRRALAGACTLAVTLAACSDTTGTSGDQLTAEESAWLAMTLGSQTSAAAGTRASISAAEGAAAESSVPSPFSFALDLTVPCPLGGNAKVAATMAGTVDQATHSLTADLTGSLAPAACVVRSERGVSFTLTGTPALTSASHVAFTNGQPTGEHTASLQGGFSWSASDGRTGTCTVDYTARANYGTNQATVNGSFCGSTVSYAGPLK